MADVADRTPARRSMGPLRVVAIICVLGVVLTVLGSWAVARVDRNTEERLLEVQTLQAGTVLSTAIFFIQQPLRTSLDVQAFGGPEPDPRAFRQVMSTQIGDAEQLFVSASLWRRGPRGLTRHAPLGEQPWLDPRGSEVQEFLERALDSPTFVVRRIDMDGQSHIAYALADPVTGLVVYAESAVEEDRRTTVEGDAAFANLDYAIYIGEDTDLAAMTTTSVDPGDLPLDGRTFETTVPFGDSVITLVTSPRRHLGGSLSLWLPLIVLLGGLFLTAAAALVARQLVRARAEAEDSTATITALYERVDSLYEDQRALSVRLQRALLPQVNPRVPGLRIASEYVAGGQGVDIGGDWYSIVGIGEDRFAFVVGDVSGHGVDAVAVMARARFTLRAYLVDGDSPEQALEKCSRQFDISVDEHMITAVVGVGNARTGEVTVATAGHPPPLLLQDARAEYVDLPVGPPLGIGPSRYVPATLTLAEDATLLLFTDGLIERRSEPIDVGMDRLAVLAGPLADDPVGDLVSSVVATLRTDTPGDDIAVLALRRVVGS